MSALAHPTGPFRHRDFRWMFVGTFVSTALQWLQQTTLGWLAYDITGSGLLVGLVLGIRVVPMLLLSPLSGVVAERYDQRLALSLTQLFLAVPAFLIAASLALGTLTTWQLIVFSLVTGSAATFDRTLRNAVVFRILPREEMTNGMALINIAFSVTRAFGPVLAGVLIALAGPAWCFGIQGVLAIGVILSLARLAHRPAVKRTHRASAWADMKAGLHYGITDPAVRQMLLLRGAACMLLIPTLASLMPIFAADVFHVGPQGLGLMLGAGGVGAILGSMLASFLSRFDRVGMLQALSVGAFAVSMIAFAAIPVMGLALVVLALGTAAEMIVLTSTAASMQLAAPDALRGRVASLVAMSPLFISSGNLIAGWFADLMGAPVAATVLALIALAIAAFSWLRSGVLRGLTLSSLIHR